MGTRRVLHCARFFYLDTSNGAAPANRALMACLARRGFVVEALCGAVVDAGGGRDPADVLAALGLAVESQGEDGNARWEVGAAGVVAVDPATLRVTVDGLPVTVHRRPTCRYGDPDPAGAEEFLRLFDATLARFRPDVLVSYGGDPLTLEILARARRRGVVTVFTLHNFGYPRPDTFADADAVLVASRFSAEYHRRALGIECAALPYLIDRERVRAERVGPGYVVYVNPSAEKGVFPFAAIADALGRRRPDISLLVVESRGDEFTLAGCGLDLRAHGNVFLMGHTPDPRDFWRVARVCLVPSLWWENQPLVAVEAMVNGIPVVGSDRGGIPETLGAAGVVLPLPDRLTPFSRDLPTPEEITPWVEAVIRLWDDEAWYSERGGLALRESRRWAPEVLEPRYVEFFQGVRPRVAPPLKCPVTPPDRPTPPGVRRAGDTVSPFVMASRHDFGSFLNARRLLGRGAEVGVQNGYFSRQILDRWAGELLYLIDIWQPLDDYRDVSNVRAAEQVERMVTAIKQVSPHWPRVRVLQEMSETAARMIPDGSLDWVYIDANHDYENVKRDLEVWVPKVRDGGLVSGHDFLDGRFLIHGVETVFEVKRAVREFFEGDDVRSTGEPFPTWFVTK